MMKGVQKITVGRSIRIEAGEKIEFIVGKTKITMDQLGMKMEAPMNFDLISDMTMSMKANLNAIK